MQANFLPMKFQGWKFCRLSPDCENSENYMPQKFVRIQYMSWLKIIRDNINHEYLLFICVSHGTNVHFYIQKLMFEWVLYKKVELKLNFQTYIPESIICCYLNYLDITDVFICTMVIMVTKVYQY